MVGMKVGKHHTGLLRQRLQPFQRLSAGAHIEQPQMVFSPDQANVSRKGICRGLQIPDAAVQRQPIGHQRHLREIKKPPSTSGTKAMLPRYHPHSRQYRALLTDNGVTPPEPTRSDPSAAVLGRELHTNVSQAALSRWPPFSERFGARYFLRHRIWIFIINIRYHPKSENASVSFKKTAVVPKKYTTILGKFDKFPERLPK